jgi:predicted DNA-binding transcriptional regulator AlpA
MKSFISAPETAKRLNISQATLTRWRQARRGPPVYKVGKSWKYDEQELAEFIQSCRRASEEFSAG